MAIRPNQNVTPTTPPNIELKTQIVRVEATAADAVGFAAFVLPKYAIVCGAWTYTAVSNATQTINVGTTLGGTQLINAVPTVTVGFADIGNTAGANFGVQASADTLYYAKASATLTSAVILRIDYYIPQQGNTY